MPEIEEIPESDYGRFLELSGNAYPAFAANSEEELKKHLTQFKRRGEDKRISHYDYYREGKLLRFLILTQVQRGYTSTPPDVPHAR